MPTHHRGAYYMPTTPWTARPKQEIDKDAYFRQIQRLIPHAKSIICGAATGEAYELTPREMIELVAVALKAVDGRANVYGSLPWETVSAVSVCESIMELGAAGAMELPPTYAYVGQHGIEQRYRATSAATGKNLIVYAKGDAGVIPSDAIIARLAGEGLICAVKRACDSAPFEVTAKAVTAANPSVLKIQGAAERFVPGVVGLADGYTTGSGVVFPNISRRIESAFLSCGRSPDRATSPDRRSPPTLSDLRQLIEIFTPIELMRAQHGTAYNIAPLKWLLKHLYHIGTGEVRPRFMDLLPADEAVLQKLAPAIAEQEQEAA
jgi:dihydrodipicolinate synthase/N-acetylneuraminate lyase